MHTLIVSQSVSWCFEPSQPQRITSGLNTNFVLSPSYLFHKTLHHNVFFEPIYIPWALSTGTCIQQGDLFHSAGLHRNRRWSQPTQETLGRGFGKNAGEWTERVEISEEEIPGSKHSMHGYTDLLQALKGEPLSSVFSSDGTLISASAAPHCRGQR